MSISKNRIIKQSCRICLTSKNLCALFKYNISGNYAEMLTSVADVKVSVDDGLPDKLCSRCCTALEKAYYLKTLAERNDKKLRRLKAFKTATVTTKKISFDSFSEVKNDIKPLVKNEMPWGEIQVLTDTTNTKPIETMDGKDIVIANTVIKKVDPNSEIKPKVNSSDFEVSWKEPKSEVIDNEVEFLDDDIYQDDVADHDYLPPVEKKKKLKRPKLSNDVQIVKILKSKPNINKKVKVIDLRQEADRKSTFRKEKQNGRSTTITCYPILKNGAKGPPIVLRRPKDATILKVDSNCKTTQSNPMRITRMARPVVRQKEKMVCPVCGILTFTLNIHMATHEEKKRYPCTQCNKSFIQKANLQEHMKHHAGIKDHICEVCGAGFYNQKSLVRHNLIHTGERPFACTLCTKRFIARCDLNRHMRIHSGYKPYKCMTCTMSFNAKHQLQNHERMHTGERPYTCEVCNVAFSYKVNLNNHVFKVHGINLKFKSIHVVTEEILQREASLVTETRAAIANIIPQMNNVPVSGPDTSHVEYTVNV